MAKTIRFPKLFTLFLHVPLACYAKKVSKMLDSLVSALMQQS